MNIHDPQTIKDDVGTINFIGSQIPYFMVSDNLEYFQVSLLITSFLNLLQEPLLKIELNNPALLSGNWTQLCATCKVPPQLPSLLCISYILNQISNY